MTGSTAPRNNVLISQTPPPPLAEIRKPIVDPTLGAVGVIKQIKQDDNPIAALVSGLEEDEAAKRRQQDMMRSRPPGLYNQYGMSQAPPMGYQYQQVQNPFIIDKPSIVFIVCIIALNAGSRG